MTVKDFLNVANGICMKHVRQQLLTKGIQVPEIKSDTGTYTMA